MSRTFRASLVACCVLGVIVGGWLWWRGRPAVPVAVDTSVFANWPITASDGRDPWVVGVQPPDTLIATLTADVARRAGHPMISPPHVALPLVLRTEFSEGLQGVYGTDSVMRMAHDALLDSSRFEPVCLAHRTMDGPDGRAEVYFVPFESPAFSQLRVDLIPAFPEQAGVGVSDPSTLSPILIVAASDAQFDRWWPLTFNRDTDCVASVTGSAAAGH